MSENKFYQVFMFAIEEHAEMLRKEFGGERMHPFREGQRDALGAMEEGFFHVGPSKIKKT